MQNKFQQGCFRCQCHQHDKAGLSLADLEVLAKYHEGARQSATESHSASAGHAKKTLGNCGMGIQCAGRSCERSNWGSTHQGDFNDTQRRLLCVAYLHCHIVIVMRSMMFMALNHAFKDHFRCEHMHVTEVGQIICHVPDAIGAGA